MVCLIEQATQERERIRQLLKTPGSREDGTIMTLMIDHLAHLLKRLPTKPTLAAIIERADNLLGQSNLTNGDAVYVLLSDIEGWIRSNQDSILRIDDLQRTMDTITGYEEHKGTDNIQVVAAVHHGKSKRTRVQI